MMMRNFTLLFLMFLTLNQLSAQEWVVYDGSVSPDSVFTPKPSGSTILTTAILDDPMLEGNKIFMYKVEEGMHRWQADLELPQNGVTLVSRVRADLDPDFYVVNFALRNGAVRPDIRVESGRINPDKVVVNANHDIDMTKWHVIRIALKSDNSLKVFMDENPVPVMVDTGKDATMDQYIQWGDGSSSSDYGGLIDWMVYDTTGAYAPGEGLAIPDSLSLNSAQSIIFITPDDRDDEQIAFLESQGFAVTKFYPGALSAAGQDTIDMLNGADLVIVGRSAGSGDFDSPDKEIWNALTVPMILNGQYDARSNRINWFNSTNAYHSNDVPLVAYGLVSDPGDPIFANVTLAGDSLDWCYPAHDFLGLDSTTNGDILVAYAGRNPLVVRFEEGVEFYEGSVDFPAGPRTYFGFGNDNAGEANFFPLTRAAKTAYVAEICRITGQEAQLPLFGTADSRVLLITPDDRDDVQYNWLAGQGLNVTKFYPGVLSAAGQDTIDMLNSADLVIVGRSAGSGDFDSPDKEIWNALTVPLILNGQYDARSSRINWFNSTNAYHSNDGPAVAYGVVSAPDDPVFAGVNLMVGDSLGWCYPAHDFLGLDSTTNGDILAAYADRNPLLVRFEEGVEFYEGSVDMPAGPRTYFGFGNDNAGAANFFPLTRDAKTVYLAEISRMLGIGVPEVVFGVADYNITLITPDDRDDPQIKFLEKNNIRVNKFYPGVLSAAGQDTIDMLNTADLLIIGRSAGSGDFDSPDKEIWNGLTAPLILNGQYDARSNRINWFNSTSAYHSNTGPDVAYGVTGMPDDVVFSNVTLKGDSLGWLLPPHDFLGLDSVTNGTIVAAYAGRNPLLVRFDAGVEFYPGAVDMPAAARTYFGFGNDNAGPANFFPLTADGQQVYLNEISRILNADVTTVKTIDSDVTLSALDYSVTTAVLTPGFDPEVMSYSLQLVQDSSVVDLMATPTSEVSTVVGDSIIDVSEGDTIMTQIRVTAENGNYRNYEVTVYPFVVIDGTDQVISSTSSLKLYPNPANDLLNIATDGEISHVTVYNAVGRVVMDQSFRKSGEVQISVSELQTGLYLIKVKYDDQNSMTKFLKK